MNRVVKTIFEHRKISAILLLSVVSVVMFVDGDNDQTWITKTYLPIENIKIEGKFENLLQQDIQKTIKAILHGGYFTVDIDAIRNALIKLPWVEDVSIRRHWPAGLDIIVTEKRPIAYWGKDKLLSDRGELFSPEIVSHELTLPQLNGPDDLHKTVWLFLKDTNKKIQELEVVVKQLDLDNRRSWEIRLSNNVVVKLGRENTDIRLQRFIKVFKLDDTLNMQDIELIDLRYPNGFAMRLKKTETYLNKSALVKEV